MKLKTCILTCLLYFPIGPVHAQESSVIQRLLGQASTSTKDSVVIRIRSALAVGVQDQDSATQLLLPLLQYTRQINFDAGTGAILITLGQWATHEGAFSKGLELLQEAGYYSKQSAMRDSRYGKQSMLLWYGGLSHYYSELGQYQQSLYYSLKGISLFQESEMKNNEHLIVMLANIGEKYGLYLKDDKKALTYLDEAERLARKYHKVEYLSPILQAKAGAYFQTEQYDSAYILLLAALDSYVESEIFDSKWSIYANLAATMLHKKDYRQAQFYVDKAVAVGLKDSIEQTNIYLQYMISQVYFYAEKNYNKAEETVSSAIYLAEKLYYERYLADYYDLLAKIYIAQGAYKKAYAAREQAITEEKKVADKLQLQAVNELEVKYQVLKRDKAISDQQLLILTKDHKLKKKNLWMAGISGFLLLIVLGGTIYSRREAKIRSLKALIEGEENERTRIARELHDGVNQTIGSVKTRLMALEHELSPLLLPAPKASFSETIQLVDDCFVEVRQISHNMMPRALAESSLPVALEQLVAALNGSVPDIRLYLHGLTDKRYPPLMETSVYRIVQEGISNVIRHAHARRMDISVLSHAKGLDIIIGDDGIGFDFKKEDRNKGVGLKNISARVRLLHGKMELDTAPGKGTRIAICLPVPS